MLAKFSTTFLFVLAFSAQLYSQTSIVGNWKRIMPTIKYKGSIIKQNHYGDLEIREDSTFHIQGDTTNQRSTTPGWHVGDECNGTWELKKTNALILWLDPKENKLFLIYKIITLNKEKLVLRSNFDKNNEHDITFLRL